MIRTRIIKEELYICIYCPHTWGYDQMGGYNVPEKIFYDEPYTNEETAETLLTLAKKEHKKIPITHLQKDQFWKDIGKHCQRRSNMSKCPNCGSTAQIKQLSEKYTRLPTVTMTDTFCKCGCGHKFWYYKREDYRGVREGTTFVYTTKGK